MVINESFSVAQIHSASDFDRLEASILSRSLNVTRELHEINTNEFAIGMTTGLPKDSGLPPAFLDHFGLSLYPFKAAWGNNKSSHYTPISELEK